LLVRKRGDTLRDVKNVKKIEAIAEILGLLEETGKGKDWIVQEIKKHKIKIKIKSDMNSVEILKASPDIFVSHLLQVIKNEDLADFQDIKTLTKTYQWFYTDIVGSANPAVLTKDQAQKVWALNELIGRTETFRNRDTKSDVMDITGDGMIIGFSDSPEKPLRLAIELHKIISRYNQSRKGKNQLGIRIGIDTGPVYFIKDLTGKDNFWGPGIIMARRVMDLARPMQILASSRIAADISKLSPEYKSSIHYIGEYKIKHGEKLKLFNIYGDGWGNKLAPLGKIEPKKADEGPNPVRFVFPKIELKLDIRDPKNMMTHHTWIWNIVNITEASQDQVSYFIDGDVPKDFAELNVTIKDEKNKKLKILSVDANKPNYKQFVVKLNRPLKPYQKRKLLKLEYDWEEPERHFSYNLASDCKKFMYLLTVPKGIEIKPRVLKVDPATKYKTYASPESEIKYLKDRTEVRWQATNLRAYEAYRFEW